jgi:prepilin-type N-terminal cleavage/methylation domain-containing protein
VRSEAGREWGWTLIEVLVAVAVGLILAGVLLYYCNKGPGPPDLSAAGINQQLKGIITDVLGNPSVTGEQVSSAADKVAREVIKKSLENGKSKAELKTWCEQVIAKLTEEKRGLSDNDQRVKFQKAIDAIKAVCDELLGH